MISPVLSALRRINDVSHRRLNILTFPTHEGYQTLLGHVPHNFYMITGEKIKNWDFHTRPLPSNHHLIVNTVNSDQLRVNMPIDLFLTQDRTYQPQIAFDVASKLNIPIIHIDHTEPPPGLDEEQIQQIKSYRVVRHAYITEHNKKSWGGHEEDLVINHGIDTQHFQGWTGTSNRGITVVNLFRERDIFCGWTEFNQIINENVQCEIVGFNPELQTESINDLNRLRDKYCEAAFYLNTSKWSPVPMSVLEAMSCGCPVVTTAHQELPRIIENGINGFISNDINELRSYCSKLVEDKDLARKIGEAGRNTILERYNLESFVQAWDRYLWESYQVAR